MSNSRINNNKVSGERSDNLSGRRSATSNVAPQENDSSNSYLSNFGSYLSDFTSNHLRVYALVTVAKICKKTVLIAGGGDHISGMAQFGCSVLGTVGFTSVKTITSLIKSYDMNVGTGINLFIISSLSYLGSLSLLPIDYFPSFSAKALAIGFAGGYGISYAFLPIAPAPTSGIAIAGNDAMSSLFSLGMANYFFEDPDKMVMTYRMLDIPINKVIATNFDNDSVTFYATLAGVFASRAMTKDFVKGKSFGETMGVFCGLWLSTPLVAQISEKILSYFRQEESSNISTERDLKLVNETAQAQEHEGELVESGFRDAELVGNDKCLISEEQLI